MAYQVGMIESEAGWGDRIDEVLFFRKKENAERYVQEYNNKYNNQPNVPNWYIVAKGPYQVPDKPNMKFEDDKVDHL